MTHSVSFRTWTGLLAVVGGLVRCAPSVAAQELVVPGQVLDARDRPVAGIEVILHRVTPEGGALVARDTTDAGGRFELRTSEEAGEPVYFVATRHEGELHIGPMLRTPFPASDYVLRVGGAAPAASANVRTAAIVVVFLALTGLAFARAVRPPERRRLLLRLAEIEEDRASSGDAAAHTRERGRILARLRHGPTS